MEKRRDAGSQMRRKRERRRKNKRRENSNGTENKIKENKRLTATRSANQVLQEETYFALLNKNTDSDRTAVARAVASVIFTLFVIIFVVVIDTLITAMTFCLAPSIR